MGYIRVRNVPGNVSSVQTRRTDHVARNVASETKWVPSKELIRREKRNVCFRCGGDGHRIRDCSFGPAERPVETEGGFDGRRK